MFARYIKYIAIPGKRQVHSIQEQCLKWILDHLYAHNNKPVIGVKAYAKLNGVKSSFEQMSLCTEVPEK